MSGALPLGWRWATFSDVAHIAANLVDPKDFPNLPHIAPDNIERSTGRLLAYRTVKQDGVTSANHRFYPGQLLYSKIRPYLNKCVRVEFEGLCSADMYPLDPLIEPGYLHHYILTREFVSAVTKAAGSRTVLPKTNQKQLANVPVPVAPSEQQPAIVAAIDSHFSRLDAATATLERVQRNLERYRASVLKAAVEGRLVPTEADLAKKEGRSFEPASVLLKRILAERRRRWEEAELAKLKAKGKPPTDDRWRARYKEPALVDSEHLPELPAGWCWASLDQVVVVGPQNGLYVPKSSYGRGTSIVRVDDYQDQFSRAASELLRVSIDEGRAEAYGLAVGDLLVNRVNSPTHLGKSLVAEARHVPAVFESNIMRMRISGGLLPTFVHYYLCSLDGRRRLLANAKWAVNQASINQQDVLTTPLPLPPADEAARIAMAIEEAVMAKSSVQASVGASLRHVARLRQSLLKWAFEGRLVDQHPEGAPTRALVDNPATMRRPASTEPSARR